MKRSLLFEPVKLGKLWLPNGVLMAPLTRLRAEADGTPGEMIAKYYEQRASAGLIISEMTVVSAKGQAYLNAPGMYTEGHRKGWRRVTDAVHGAGGRIFSQLAHAGRISHPSLLPGGAIPVGASAVRPAGHVHTRSGSQPYVTPRALEIGEIGGVVKEFADAARMAMEAGFDGVELHSANGYLLDQFLRDGTNWRQDGYGGPAKGRARLLLEVVEAVTEVWGAGRVGVRLSPFNGFNDMSDTNPRETFTVAAEALSGRGLAYLHIFEPVQEAWLTPRLRQAFGGALVVNGGFDVETGNAVVEGRSADAVAFGVPFLANPDLPERLRAGLPLNRPDPTTFYTGGARGYIDYPVHSPIV
ncbi:MAG: alkene reductase [Bryobacterales bacterium]|nr:alkene reductase [Bryobacterales bacterium]